MFDIDITAENEQQCNNISKQIASIVKTISGVNTRTICYSLKQ